jgi:predicted O-methyltransferase YrrM
MPLKKIIAAIWGVNVTRQIITHLPQAELAELFPKYQPDIKMLEAAAANGNVSLHELFTLNFAVAATAPKVVFEIGTFDGRTTLNLAANSPADARVFTLDLPATQLNTTKFTLAEFDRSYVEKPASGARFQNKPEAAKITQLLGDSATFDFSPYHNSVDFLFVDGSHAYDYVLNDSYIALKLLRNGKGVIFWHDYGRTCWRGVIQALEKLQRENPAFKNIKHIKDTTIACLVLN